MKTGIIDVGGGFRGVYACAVLDYCLDHDIGFDTAIGVSAGSANLASFLAGQKDRNYRFYIEYGHRREYASLHNYRKNRSYFDMDYIYSALSNSGGEDPLDFDALRQNSAEFYVVATDAVTGRARYFTKDDLGPDRYDVFKASGSIPAVNRPIFLNGHPFYDGALSDPVPLEKAFALGCDRVVLLLTRPLGLGPHTRQDRALAARVRRRYPLAAEGLCLRTERYHRGVALAQEYAAQGKVLIVAPEDDTCGVDTLTRDPASLRRLYVKGYGDGKKIEEYLRKG